jgi:hypothetical protein
MLQDAFSTGTTDRGQQRVAARKLGERLIFVCIALAIALALLSTVLAKVTRDDAKGQFWLTFLYCLPLGHAAVQYLIDQLTGGRLLRAQLRPSTDLALIAVAGALGHGLSAITAVLFNST